MRKAIVYASVHHGNTEKLVKRIAEEFFKVSSVDIGICREESTGRQKDISDLYLWWECEL